MKDPTFDSKLAKAINEKSAGEKSPELLDISHGSFVTDTALMIVDAKIQTGRLFLTVRWAKRPDGCQPEDTVFTNTEIKRHNPLILCEFYERMLKVNIMSSKPPASELRQGQESQAPLDSNADYEISYNENTKVSNEQ